MVVDPERKFVRFTIIGGYDKSNGEYNFNGFSEGELTLTVPLGWEVEMQYTTRSLHKIHSLAVVEESWPLPEEGGAPAFPGAATTRLVQGIPTNHGDTFRFIADKTGRYLLVCGVGGHAGAGMWDYLEVSDAVDRPGVHIERKARSE